MTSCAAPPRGSPLRWPRRSTAVLRGGATEAQLHACIDAKHELLTQFTATPFRPTGLAITDQAVANAVELLEWCTSLVVDSVHERSDLRDAAPSDRELLDVAAQVLRRVRSAVRWG